jgi:hypothetical protein
LRGYVMYYDEYVEKFCEFFIKQGATGSFCHRSFSVRAMPVGELAKFHSTSLITGCWPSPVEGWHVSNQAPGAG